MIDCKPSVPQGQGATGAGSRARKVFVGGLSAETTEGLFNKRLGNRKKAQGGASCASRMVKPLISPAFHSRNLNFGLQIRLAYQHSMISMVTLGGDLQSGCVAARFVSGLSQLQIIHELRHRKEMRCVSLMKEMRNNLRTRLMQQ
eukprot:scaffold49252_cov16-Tisochrysis_lutea.AAC.2